MMHGPGSNSAYGALAAHHELLPQSAATRPKLTARATRRSALIDREIDAMRSLLARHFHGVDHSVFINDLMEKDWVVLLEDDRQVLRGFSTFAIYDTGVGGEKVTVVYSGDTIVEPAAWGTALLPRTWIHAVYAAWQSHQTRSLYWLLLTSGFRTYRFIPVFWRTFYPRFDQPTPPELQTNLDALSIERFGERYDRRTGIVRLAKPQALQGALSCVPDSRTSDPHVRFFLERNPGHVVGDELVSLVSLLPENLTLAGRRMVR